MKIKEIERTVNVSWSPAAQHPILLAAGTAAQQLDASFSTTAALEIYSLNLTEPGLDMELRTSVPSDYRFHKIAWGSYGFGIEHGNGIIVGGCDGGNIQIYNAAKVLSGEEGLLAHPAKHSGPVRALDFNPYQANLLATGASESEILIWDLNNTNTPMLPGAKSQPADDVLCLSWNRQVQHILASTFAPRCVVWDLRKNEPIIKVTDSTSRIRWKVVAWHPEVSTQLCLASEEDQTPVIQLWDLRFATSPLKVLESHQRGVLSIAWCSQDPDLLVSCGKDSRILCWNPNSSVPGGEVVCDITTASQWNFDVTWCPRNPALIASSSYDGRVSIYSLTGGQQQVQTSNKIADSFPGMDTFAQAPPQQQQHHQSPVELRKAPKWLRRPVGAGFAFGGKLVSFGNEIAQGCQTGKSQAVYVSQVVTEPELIAHSNELETVLQNRQYTDFCQARIMSSTAPHERSVWNFVRASFKTDSRAEFQSLLGLKPDEMNSKLPGKMDKADKPANARPAADLDNLSERVVGLGHEISDGGAGEAFDAIAAASSYQMSRLAKIQDDLSKILITDDTDGRICRALLLGNVEEAVEMCLLNGRAAEALIFATAGGSDLVAKTTDRYLQQTKGCLSVLMSAVVTRDWSPFVRACEVDSWKEALTGLLTFTKDRECYALCEFLGARLEAEGKGALCLNAQLCYICAGNPNKLVESWTATEGTDSLVKLQQLVEVVMLLMKAVEEQGRAVEVSGKLAQVLSHYAAALASQGNLTAALTYLRNSNDEHMTILRDRLNQALGLSPAYQQHQPQLQQPTVSHTPSRLPALPRQPPFVPQQQSAPTPYGQGSSGPAVPPTSMFPTQQPQTAAKSFASPAVPNFYPPNTASRSGVQPKPMSPAPAVSGDPQPHGGFMNPSQYSIPPAPGVSAPPGTTATYGGVYSPLDPNVYQKAWESAQTGDKTANISRSSGTSTMSRKPYMLDPSVQTGPQYGSAGAMYPTGFTTGPAPNSPVVPTYPSQPVNTRYPSADIYNPADSINTQTGGVPPSIPPVNAPPAWNDPPVLKNSSRTQQKAEYMPQNAITHPLYGTTPQEPGPPMSPNMAVNSGGYVDPLIGAPYQPQQQYPQQQYISPVAPAKMAEPPKAKHPIPEEHIHLQTVFKELLNRCTSSATNLQQQRRLENISRNLENLYDALREFKLSPVTLQGLHQMAQMVQIGDYAGGLSIERQVVAGPDFSEIASFMPGLKLLLQTALQLQVYLQ